MYLFLKYLFKLKPKYKTKVSEVFRIIIENNEVYEEHGQKVC